MYLENVETFVKESIGAECETAAASQGMQNVALWLIAQSETIVKESIGTECGTAAASQGTWWGTGPPPTLEVLLAAPSTPPPPPGEEEVVTITEKGANKFAGSNPRASMATLSSFETLGPGPSVPKRRWVPLASFESTSNSRHPGPHPPTEAPRRHKSQWRAQLDKAPGGSI